MAIDDIKGLYNLGIEAAPKKRSFAQKLGPYMAAGMLLAYSPVIVNAQENKYLDRTFQKLNDDFAKYKKIEKVSLIAGLSALVAGWVTAGLKGKTAETIHDASVFVFCGSAGIGLHALGQDSDNR